MPRYWHPREASRFPNSAAFEQLFADPNNVRLGARISFAGAGYNLANGSGNTHERDYADFSALISAATGADRPELFDRAFAIVRSNGYALAIADVPDTPAGQRAAFTAWVRQSPWARWPSLGPEWFA